MSVRATPGRFWHQPGDGSPRNNGQTRKKESQLIPAKTPFADAEKRGIDQDAAQQPAHEILSQIARALLISSESRDGLPPGNIRAHFPVTPHQTICLFSGA